MHKISVTFAESEAQSVTGGRWRGLKSSGKVKRFEVAFEGAE